VILLAGLLVLAAAVALAVGLLVDAGTGALWTSVALSLCAAAALAVGVAGLRPSARGGGRGQAQASWSGARDGESFEGLVRIEGVDPAVRDALARRYGELDALRAASAEEIAATEGVDADLAARIARHVRH
jgi:hypothetical protein